jgi:hypothetical protein
MKRDGNAPKAPPKLEPMGGEESGRARGVSAHVEELRWDAECASEQVGVDAIEPGESLERGVLLLERGVGEGHLILLCEVGLLLAFLESEFVGKIGEAGRVAGARDAIVGSLLE